MKFFEPSSSERRGLLVLSAAIILILMVTLLALLTRASGSSGQDGRQSSSDFVRHTERPTPKYYAVEERDVETFPFDPNTADSTTLLRLGFSPSMVRGMYRYRAKGGRYHEPADLSYVPGMTNELWDRISPYIRIDRKYQYVTPQPRTARPHAMPSGHEQTYVRDTVRYPVKMRVGETVELNQADTSALKKIPGIGSYYARQIVRYRQELGGYTSTDQLQEIDGMPEDVGQWLRLDASLVQPIDVNHATKNQLLRHPYLRTYRARAIWDYRHNFGPLRGIDDLRRLPDFTEADIERLRPYLEFR
ncbi:MAG: helix-hairpin-helix domain-containing protein [Bacteroidaceae bacterium]|nr:helix-hairpin-helix domain-containing protein [Bacteroidaceae bacterium]